MPRRDGSELPVFSVVAPLLFWKSLFRSCQLQFSKLSDRDGSWKLPPWCVVLAFCELEIMRRDSKLWLRGFGQTSARGTVFSRSWHLIRQYCHFEVYGIRIVSLRALHRFHRIHTIVPVDDRFMSALTTWSAETFSIMTPWLSWGVPVCSVRKFSFIYESWVSADSN